MATVVAEGTVASSGVEQVLCNSPLPATFQPMARLNNMQAGDTVVVNVKTKIGAAGTKRTTYTQTFSGVQTAPGLIQIGPPVPSGWEFEFTLTQTAGPSRNFDWRVDSLASLTVAASGTANISSAVETTVLSTASNGTFVFAVDLTAIGAAEVVTLRAKVPTLAAGTAEIAHFYTPALPGPPADPDRLMLSIPVSCAHGGVFTIQQSGVIARAYPWAVYQVGA